MSTNHIESLNITVTANGYIASEAVPQGYCASLEKTWSFESMQALTEFLALRMSKPLEGKQ